jgi:endonuclease YncB( thermonuclease family)
VVVSAGESRAARGARAWAASWAVAMGLACAAAQAGGVDARAYAAGSAAIGAARIVDGDTLALTLAGGTLRVRLHGMDAPELDQTCPDAEGALLACGGAATAAMEDLIAGRPVRCVSQGNVNYDRLVAVCSVDGIDLGGALVERGLAWASRRHSMAYVGAEDAARARALGVWQGPAVPPWAWRKGERSAEPRAEGCAIKGNVSANGRIYHLPGARSYARTQISAANGERWFCTEAEAVAAGWRPVRG